MTASRPWLGITTPSWLIKSDTPQVAVHLLEAGVEVNVIRGWLGHADLSTTNRYAEINTKTKEAALRHASHQVLRRDPAPRQSGGPTRRS